MQLNVMKNTCFFRYNRSSRVFESAFGGRAVSFDGVNPMKNVFLDYGSAD